MKGLKFIFTNVLAIVISATMLVGSTFAFFTSESEVDISVTSGKISVIASVDESSVQTKKLYDTDYAQGAGNTYEGVATFNKDGLTLERFVPGDGIKFNIVVKNESNVTIKYRTIVSCENDDGLFTELNIAVNDDNYNGSKVVSNWEELSATSNNAVITVAIELPEDADANCQGKSCTITYKVEAVQGNVYAGPDAIVTRYDENDLPKRTPISGSSMGGITFPQAPDEITVEAAWTFASTDTEETIEDSSYKDWICDFIIECDGAVSIGELGLWGAYGLMDLAFANPIALPEGQSLFMMISAGMPLTYRDICTGVKEFDCGVFRGLTGDKMQGKKITVSLCLINPKVAEELKEELALKPENQNKSEDEILMEAMRKENWAKYIGTNVLIANQTSYTFN